MTQPKEHISTKPRPKQNKVERLGKIYQFLLENTELDIEQIDYIVTETAEITARQSDKRNG